jgi:hypothetical protein
VTVAYKLRLRQPGGTLLGEVGDFLGLAYSKRRNAPGLGQFALSGEHKLVDLIADRSIVEFWRRDPDHNLDWYRDFSGLVRRQEFQRTGQETVTYTCPGALDMLRWRRVAWRAGIANRSDFLAVPAETIMKNLVKYNITALATSSGAATGRELSGVPDLVTINVEADLARGNTIDWYCGHKNLLETIQEMVVPAGGDFDLVQTGDATFEFRFYPGQRGQDRTTTTLFAIERGNVRSVRYLVDRMNRATVAIVAGQGEGTARQVELVYADDYDDAGSMETFLDGRDSDTAAVLQDRGKAELDELATGHELEIEIMQNDSTVYGVDWDLGDLVGGRYRNITATLIVDSVSVAYTAAGGERVTGGAV